MVVSEMRMVVVMMRVMVILGVESLVGWESARGLLVEERLRLARLDHRRCTDVGVGVGRLGVRHAPRAALRSGLREGRHDLVHVDHVLVGLRLAVGGSDKDLDRVSFFAHWQRVQVSADGAGFRSRVSLE